MGEPTKVSKGEISQQQAGHIVDNGQKLERDITPEMLWKKLCSMQKQMNQLQQELERVKDNTASAGGSQPNKKFTTSALTEERSGQKVLSELGLAIKDKVDSKGELDKNDFKKLMVDQGWSATAEATYRNWMQKVGSHFDSMEFKVGKRGGGNKPSRLVWTGWDE